MSNDPVPPSSGVRPEPGSEDYDELPEIDGPWESLDVADDSSSTEFAAQDFDAADWNETTSALAPRSGVRRFRKAFSTHAAAGRRYWLAIDPLPVDTSVWLDGAYIGDAERSVVSKLFDVTQAIERRDDHLLALQMTAFGDRASVPAHVRIFDTGQICITRLKVLCVEATSDSALLDVWAELDARKPARVVVRTAVEGSDEPVETSRNVSSGRTRLHWTVQVDEPALWWPRNAGSQPLRHVEVTVVDESNAHAMSDARLMTTGFRAIRRSGHQLVVNGERTNIRAVEAGRDFDLESVASGINTLVVSESALSGRFLNAADKAGLMVVAPASADARRARESVEAYGAHPSLVAWRAGRPHLASVRIGHSGQAARSTNRADPSRPLAPALRHVDTVADLDELRRLGNPDGFVVSPEIMQSCHLVRVVAELHGTPNAQSIDMYIVNDSSDDVIDGVVSLAVEGVAPDAGGVHKSWGGEAPAGTVTFVGSLTLPLLPRRAEVNVEVSLLSRARAITRTVTHTTGTDGMILDVATSSPNIATRSAAEIVRKARSVREVARAGLRSSAHKNDDHEREQ